MAYTDKDGNNISSDGVNHGDNAAYARHWEEMQAKSGSGSLPGEDVFGGINKAVGNFFEKKAAEAREAAEKSQQHREILDAIRQVFALYKAGKAGEAINCCNSYISQLGGNDYCYSLKELLPIMLYKQGKYQEAIKCDEDQFLTALCYEKMGDKEKASEALYVALCHLPASEFDESLLSTSIYSYLYEGENAPFDVKYEEAFPLVLARAEKGDKKFYKFAGDFYREGVGVDHDLETAKKWYQKGVEANDANALYAVGLFLRDGHCHYQKNKNSALEHFKKAAALGHDGAKDALKRNKFVSFLFGVVGAVGVGSVGYNLTHLLFKSNGVSVIASLVGLVAGFIITRTAWRNRKTILFFIMLGISVIGFITLR